MDLQPHNSKSYSKTTQDNLTGMTDALQPDHQLQIITFTLGTDTFGVEIGKVHEIIRKATLVPVPNSPNYVAGLINLRGNIFPVIDLKKKIHLDYGNTETKNGWVIILAERGIMNGIIVDRALKSLKLDPDVMNTGPEIDDIYIEKQYIQGTVEMNGQNIIMLDFHNILHGENIGKLKGIDDAI